MNIALLGAAFAACAGPLAAQTQRTTTSAPAPARVTLQLDSATTARFDVHGFDLRVTQLPGRDARDSSTSTATIELVKVAGLYTGDLMRLSASGAHAPSGTIEVLDSVGGPIMTIRLTDVIVISDHIGLSGARVSFEQQRISQQEALVLLSTEQQQAERDLSNAEELAKNRVVTRQDLARAREHASELRQRVALAQQRQALLPSLGPVDESLVLRFGRIEIETSATGGKGAWNFEHQTPDSTVRKSPIRPPPGLRPEGRR